MSITTINSTDNGADSLVKINDNFTDLDTTKADLASPTFTGTPTLPTGTIATTQSISDNSTKVATTAYVDRVVIPVSSETTSGVTHALTTTAGQRVIVWAKGYKDGDNNATITLKYNGVTKDTLYLGNGGGSYWSEMPFALMYTESPAAGTRNITVETTAGSINNVVIIVMKIG
jgi:hypothetical protein